MSVLLRQPGGFEGFLFGRILRYLEHPAVANREQLHVFPAHNRAGFSPLSAQVGHRDDLIAEVHHLVNLEPQIAERVEHAGDVRLVFRSP